jgi:hypothetical protein
MDTIENRASFTTNQTGGDAERAAEGLPGGAGQSPAALLYQREVNCTGKSKRLTEYLSPYHRKSRHRLIQVVEWMVREYGINFIGLLTLTFGVPGTGRGSRETWELRQQAKELDFVQKRWHSLNTHVIAKRYPAWACALETQEDGVWHFHVVVVTKFDNRTGTDVATLTNYKLPWGIRRRKQYRNAALGEEWQALRELCCKYRFGRVELVPIRTCGEAVARYLASYLTKTWKGLKASRKSRLVRFSRNISKQFTLVCSVWNLGNLIHRTRLKMAARMLNFTDYGDYADYFGPRWHYYIGDIIAGIPIPFKFGKGDFEKGVAVKILNEYAENPYAYLDEAGKKQLVAVDAALLQKFTDLAFDESAEIRWREAQPGGADNVDVGPVTPDDLQRELLETSENPF